LLTYAWWDYSDVTLDVRFEIFDHVVVVVVGNGVHVHSGIDINHKIGGQVKDGRWKIDGRWYRYRYRIVGG